MGQHFTGAPSPAKNIFYCLFRYSTNPAPLEIWHPGSSLPPLNTSLGILTINFCFGAKASKNSTSARHNFRNPKLPSYRVGSRDYLRWKILISIPYRFQIYSTRNPIMFNINAILKNGPRGKSDRLPPHQKSSSVFV